MLSSSWWSTTNLPVVFSKLTSGSPTAPAPYQESPNSGIAFPAIGIAVNPAPAAPKPTTLKKGERPYCSL